MYTDDANIIAAAFMHVMEDTDVTAAEMRSVFGDTITDLLMEVTDVSRPSDGNRRMRREKDHPRVAKRIRRKLGKQPYRRSSIVHAPFSQFIVSSGNAAPIQNRIAPRNFLVPFGVPSMSSN